MILIKILEKMLELDLILQIENIYRLLLKGKNKRLIKV